MGLSFMCESGLRTIMIVIIGKSRIISRLHNEAGRRLQLQNGRISGFFLKSFGPDIYSHFLFFQFIFTQLLIKST